MNWIKTINTDLVVRPGQKLKDAVVPTIDTARYTYMADVAIKNRIPLLFVGPTGTGKSKYLQEKLMSLPTDEYAPVFLTFSAQTSANATQNFIMGKLDKRKRGVFGPRIGLLATVFVDDLNMPSIEEYGAQPPIEVIRQYIDHGFWSDLEDTTRLNVEDVLILAAMGPPGGGKNTITDRITRHMHVVGMTDFDDESRSRIFNALIKQGMQDQKFPNEMQSLGKPIVEATLHIFTAAVQNLLPTPAKSHYTFNLRDFARVVNGVLMIPGEFLNEKSKLIRLWGHEIARVFGDRLTDDGDRQWLHKTVVDATKEYFKQSHTAVFGKIAPEGSTSVTMHDMDKLMFGVFAHPLDRNQPYDEAEDLEAFKQVAKESLEEYNQVMKTPMDLVIFTYVLTHLSRICRVLKQDGGHALLVGVGGSGRQSMARLAAQIIGYEIFQPEVTKAYGTPEWKEDIKKVLMIGGAHDRKIVFLLNDTQIKEESFLEDVDALLNSGEVANIFEPEEKGQITEKVREAAITASGSEHLTPLELYNYFVSVCRDNVHLVLGMSPIGSTLRTRLRQFPSLVNCCTIDWFQAWPEEALKVVAENFTESVELEDAERKAVVSICQSFQSSVGTLAEKFMEKDGRKVYVTPTSYLELIKAFKGLLQTKRDEILGAKEQYVVGLKQLAFAESQVSSMQEELNALAPKLVVAKEENAKMTAQIEKDTIEANKIAEVVTADEKDANEKAAMASTEKEECEAILAEAIPALKAALKALDTLKKSDMDEVKAMKSPPAGVKLVMEAVCVMRDTKPEKIQDPGGSGKKIQDYWGPAKKMLGDMKFLDSLREYDKDNIAPKVMEVIRKKYITNEGFVPELIAKASKAAEGLCRWVRAMEVYDRVAKVVAPKKIALAEKMEQVAALMEMLSQKQAELQSVKDKLKMLNDELDAKTKEKEELEAKVKDCADKLARAKKLISGLGGEKVRWGQAADALGAEYVNVTGDILLSAGVIAYLGPFTTAYRAEAVGAWVALCKKEKLPCTENFNMSTCIGDPVKIRQWHIDGLPTDALSVDNGTIVARARRWPLAIDPQGQANKWIKNTEKDNKLEVCKLSDETFMRTLENAVSFGQPVLIENVLEELDPSMESVLAKATFKKAGVIMIKLGENEIEYSDDFRLYITTKLPNPHYLPEVATKVTTLNFMITLDGLQDQLLGLVVAKERPEVEAERQELIVTSAANKKALKEVEVKILDTLTAAGSGNILEDANAIKVLDEAKLVSDDISAKQIIADETSKKIDELRKGYESVAAHSSVLFFVVASLADIDPMYQYSLGWFVNLFLMSIADSNKARELSRRLRYLQDYFTYALYTNVCRSLFEKHKLLFSFLLCSNLMKHAGTLMQGQFMFFLTGGVGLENPNEKPRAPWLSKRMWDEACRADELKTHAGLKDHIQNNMSTWRAMYDSKTPQTFEELPSPWDERLSFFDKMIVLRVLRPDKVVHASRNFVEDNLGQKFTQPPPFDLGTVFQDSVATAPLIFVLSPGADPMMALMKFGEGVGFSGEKFSTLSLGQGQGPIAQAMIEKARVDGGWVALQNCHLAESWMGTLETVCEGLTADTVHKDFRLWLTSYPSKAFPVSVLQNSSKMTNEPPDGIRMNMLQSYMNDPVSDPEFFNYFENMNEPAKHKNFQKMLFGLTFFHAIVQERRSFGPLGWNIMYGFNESDFRISVEQLKIFFEEYDDVPYDALQYLTGQCNYGGRVTDDWDRRTLVAILMNAYGTGVVEDIKFKFSRNAAFHVPAPEGYQAVIDFVKELPGTSPPEIFGMHDNVDISKEQQQTKTLFDSVLITETKAGGSGDGGVDIGGVSADILSKITEPYDLIDCLRKYPTDYNESMNTVLVQEMGRFNRLIVVIRRTLINLGKALKGLVVMNADLDNVAVNLGIGRVPDIWMKSSYPSLKPLGSYVNDLVRRLKFLSTWYDEGKPPNFWLSGFYFTQAFLTGALQNYARKYTVPIDALAFDFEALKVKDETELTTAPDDGVYIYGLFLDGARWDKDRHVISESRPKVLNDIMAPMHFKPAKQLEIDNTGTYTCPVYKTSIRQGTLSTTGHSTNFVLPVQVPSKESEDHWVRRGVALLTQLDD
jgi:dynein heavy chain